MRCVVVPQLVAALERGRGCPRLLFAEAGGISSRVGNCFLVLVLCTDHGMLGDILVPCLGPGYTEAQVGYRRIWRVSTRELAKVGASTMGESKVSGSYEYYFRGRNYLPSGIRGRVIGFSLGVLGGGGEAHPEVLLNSPSKRLTVEKTCVIVRPGYGARMP